MQKLDAESLFELRYLRDARLAPDGQRIAYGISLTEGDTERFEIWIGGRRGEEPCRLSFAGDAHSPRWSPDGRRIAFVGDGRLLIADSVSLRLSEPLTPREFVAQGSPSWSPDGARVVLCLMEHRVSHGPRRVTGNHFRVDGLGYVDVFRQHVYEVETATRTLRCLTPSAGFCSCPEWSPCGKRVLFLETDEPIPLASYSPRLKTVALADGRIVEILGKGWYITAAHWMPNGQGIAVAAALNSTLTVPTLSLWVLDAEGRNPVCRIGSEIGNVGFRNQHDMPAWDLTHDNTFVVSEVGEAFASVQCRGSVEIWRVALRGPVSIRRVVQGERSCIVLGADAASDILLFAVSTLKSPTELHIASLTGDREARITALNDKVLAKWPDVHAEPYAFESADGTLVDAWTLRTQHHSAPLPTVLSIHAGPFGTAGYAFRYDFLLLASHGFGVVFANFRGSAGYGEPFARAIMGDWGAKGFPDHMGTADSAIERGFADPERMGIWGASHGGFATCWVVGHTNRFKAAVAESSVVNFATLYYLSDAPESFALDLGGRPHEIPDRYRACSPLTYAHRCRTPTLLIHGEEDFRCPIGEAEQFYRALRDAGCTTELFRIPGCSHLGDSMGPLGARAAQNYALVDWFQRYL